MRVAIVGEPGGWHVRRLAAAVAGRGHAVSIVRWADMAAVVGCGPERFEPEPLELADAVAVRGMPGSAAPDDRLEEVVFRMDLLGRLAARGRTVVNSPRALETAIDKYLSLSRLAAAGLPVPRTLVAQDPAACRRGWNELGCDCVVKPLFGSRGRGILRLDGATAFAAWQNLPDGGARPGRVAYLQEFVPHPGWDVRILMVGDDWFAMRRTAAAGDWRTNVSLGGRPEPFIPPQAWIDLARRAAREVEADVAGVDLLPATDGRVLILEVNAVPGWRGLETATGKDVAQAVAAHLEKTTNGTVAAAAAGRR